ncbi:MAG TPA: ABC transporter permease [Caldilineaceae bacterium]|nr:ABC transporter permease [Caldilineaceae bacterium]
MGRLIGRRLLSLIFVIFSITFLTFIVGYLAPGDPILVLMGPRRDPQVYNNLRHLYGLDQPWYQQYLHYVGGLLRGNLGISYRYQNRTVNEILGNGVWVSVQLGGTALLLSLLVGIPAGIFSALRQNSWSDRLNMALMLALFSIPSFVLIPILRAVNFFGLYQHGLPSLPAAGWGRPGNWIMPVLVLAAANVGYIARLMRSSMLEVLAQDYMQTARAKGLTQRRTIYVHGLRNALLPIATVIGPALAFLVTGAFVVESLFAIPGVGFIGVQAIGQRDYPVIQGVTVILAVAVVVMNLITDIVYIFLDPRISTEEES